MKTPLPEPATQVKQCQLGDSCNCDSIAVECNMVDVFTQSQLKAAMVAAYNEAIEDAAKECEGMKVRAIRINYEDVYRHPANAIRKLKEQTP